ncbi:hypothetical protein PV327_011497, partial [Microctonus hyperodae]
KPKLFSMIPKTCSDMNNIINEMENPSPLKLICEEMNKNKDTRIIQDMLSNMYPIYSKNYDIAENLKEFYEDQICLSKDEIIQLCCNTLDQAESDNWFLARKKRISASKNVHNIKSRITKTIESLVSDILFEKKISNKSTQYGIANERNARLDYQKKYNVDIKCPESCKNLPVINEETQKVNVKYLELTNDGVQLKK